MSKNYYLKRREIRRKEILRQENEKCFKKIDEIKNLIDETFPDIEPDYNFKHLTKHYDVKFKANNGYYHTIAIDKDSTWDEIKKYIERIIKTPKLDVTTECLICYDNKSSELIFCENCFFY